jgi:hypothetical protein
VLHLFGVPLLEQNSGIVAAACTMKLLPLRQWESTYVVAMAAAELLLSAAAAAGGWRHCARGGLDRLPRCSSAAVQQHRACGASCTDRSTTSKWRQNSNSSSSQEDWQYCCSTSPAHDSCSWLAGIACRWMLL